LHVPVAHIAPVDAHGDWPIGDGEIAPIARAALDKTPAFFPQLGFAEFGNLQGIVAHGLNVEGHLEGRKVGGSVARHAMRVKPRCSMRRWSFCRVTTSVTVAS